MRRLPALLLCGLLALAALPARAAASDPGRALADATLARFPDPARLPWWYARGVFLLAADELGRRVGDASYLDYARRWGESRVRPDGTVVDSDGSAVSFWALDHLMPGAVLARLHSTTGDPRYRRALLAMRAALAAWPRTANGGFWHTVRSRGQLWADGAYMSTTFLLAYGEAMEDGGLAREEAVRQLLAYADHLQDARTGLVVHAYHELRTAPWASAATGRSPAFWCRANGWYGMALVNVMDALPQAHPQRERLLARLRRLVAGLVRYQDPKSRLWFEVIDKGALAANWTETSCSAMHALVIARGVRRGWLDPSLGRRALAAGAAVTGRARRGPDGLVSLAGTVMGTSVGDLAYYLARPRPSDDLHGLGAFVLMQEELSRSSRPRP